MKVLVTGAAGFVGSHVVDGLIDSGCEVIGLDVLLPAAHSGPPAYLNPKAEHLRVDLRDLCTLERAVEGVDAVSHQAGMVGLGTSFADVTDYVEHNDMGTAVLLKALAAARFSGRFVLASSMVVYGEGLYECARHGHVRPPARERADLAAGRFEPLCPVCERSLDPCAIDEDAPLDPRSVYAATKLHQEHLCSAFGRATGAPVAALRYHNVYGARMPADSLYAGVASMWRSALAKGRAPQVFEDGRQMRDFVHVSDVARANIEVLTRSRPVSGAFNVASGAPIAIGAMAETLAAAFGADAPAPEVTGDFRLGDVRHLFASPRRAEEILGFRAAVEVRRGLGAFATEPLRTR